MAWVEPPADLFGPVAIRFQYQTVSRTATAVAVDKAVVRALGDFNEGRICWIQLTICLPAVALLRIELLELAMLVRANQGRKNEIENRDEKIPTTPNTTNSKIYFLGLL